MSKALIKETFEAFLAALEDEEIVLRKMTFDHEGFTELKTIFAADITYDADDGQSNWNGVGIRYER